MICDNHLVVMLAALLRSIDSNCRYEKNVNIYIVSDGINRKNKIKLNTIVRNDRIKIIWKNIEEVIPSDFKVPADHSNFPVNTYVRLFLFYFLPPSVKKAIYMDVDTIVLEDIAALWQIDLKNYPLAAVCDKIKLVSEPDHGIRNYESLGLSPDTKYFNSGIMVVNLEAWKDGLYTRQVFKVIEDNRAFIKYPDQYGLNVVFANNWLELDKRWNHFASQKIEDAAYVIHFISIKPLYVGYNFDEECKKIFYSYLSMTPWRSYKPKNDYHWKLQQFRFKLSKQTKREIFAKVLRRMRLIS